MSSEIEISYEDALKAFFDYNLKPGMAYGTKTNWYRGTGQPNDTLVYQDGSACMASFAFSNVFLTSDGSYNVITNYRFCGKDKMVETKCKTLINVLDELYIHSDYDPNSTGEMMHYFFEKKQIYQHIKNNGSISELFKNDTKKIIELNDLSLKGKWVYNKSSNV